MLQTVKFKKQKKQAEVGSSVDLNGDLFSKTFSWKKQNSTAQHEFWHMSNQTHVMLLHFLMASEHWVD